MVILVQFFLQNPLQKNHGEKITNTREEFALFFLNSTMLKLAVIILVLKIGLDRQGLIFF